MLCVVAQLGLPLPIMLRQLGDEPVVQDVGVGPGRGAAHETAEAREHRPWPVRAAAVPPTPAQQECLEGDRLVPSDVYEVPVSQRARLQSELDARGVVRLQAADYRSGGPGELHLSSGQRIYGMPASGMGETGGTTLPKIVVAPGTKDALVSGVRIDGLEFGTGSAVTEGNCFRRLRGGTLSVAGASLENNLFLDLWDVKIDIDTRSAGYLRNNRFIRVKVQSVWPALVMRGDAARRSTNNVWLWFNLLTPWGSGLSVDNQADMTMVGFDAERWNQLNLSSMPMFQTGAMGVLRLFGFEGANNGPASHLRPTFDIAADELHLYNSSIVGGANPEMVLRPENIRSALVNLSHEPGPAADQATRALRFAAFTSRVRGASLNGRDLASTPPSAADQEALATMLTGSGRAVEAWERPAFGPIADPVGSTDVAGLPDSTDYIQGLIDRDGVARLPAGVYAVSRSLVLRGSQGILGDGQGRTAIVAKSDAIDLFVSADNCQGTTLCNPGFFLADLTLQGGRNGIHWTQAGAGPAAQFAGIVLSHVTFRDFADAGLFVDGICGLDNNLLDHLTFYRNAAGVKQRSYWSGQGEPGQSYLDKNVFFHNRFVENARGMDLQATRVDVQNSWVNSLFQGNTAAAADLKNNLGPLFANTDFVDNGGAPSVFNNSYDPRISFVAASFRSTSGGGSMVPSQATVEGSSFARSGSSSATIVPDGASAVFINSQSSGMPMGRLADGLLVNSSFSADAALSQRVVQMRGNSPRTLVTGSAAPEPQLLVGKNLVASGGSNPTPPPATATPVPGSPTPVGTNPPTAACPIGQFQAQYFDNMTLSGTPVLTRCEATINNQWLTASPAPGVPAENFSVRWLGRFNFGAGNTTFTIIGDDGIRAWVDGVSILDQWKDQGPTTYTAQRTLTNGQHDISVEYYDNTLDATARFSWQGPTYSGTPAPTTPTATLTPTPRAPTATPAAPTATANPRTPTTVPTTPPTTACAIGQFQAEYFNNKTLSGTPVLKRCEATIDNQWLTASPAPGVSPDSFSIRWTGRFNFGAGNTTFSIAGDDGIRVWVDGVSILDQWKDQPPTTYTAQRTLTNGTHDVKVEYFDNTLDATAKVSWQGPAYTGAPAPSTPKPSTPAPSTPKPTTPTATPIPTRVPNTPVPATPVASCSVGQYRAEYFNNKTLSGAPTQTRCESAINYHWLTAAPVAGVNPDGFSVRWTGTFNFPAGTTTFTIAGDDGIRVWIDGTSILNQWKDQAPSDYTVPRSLTAGQHTVKVEMYDNTLDATAIVRWQTR
jgi:hypothetical protein